MAKAEHFDLDRALCAARAGLEEMQSLCGSIEESLSGVAQVQARVRTALTALEEVCVAMPSDAHKWRHSQRSSASDAGLAADESEWVRGESESFDLSGARVALQLQGASESTTPAKAEAPHGDAQLPELHQEYRYQRSMEPESSQVSTHPSVSMDRHTRLSMWISQENRIMYKPQHQKSEVVRHPCVMGPHSYPRNAFDALSMLVLVFDVFIIPVVMAWDLDFTGWISYCALCSLVHWTLDILATFRTAIYVKGVLEYSPRVLAKHYLSSWFALDFLVVLADWLSMISMEFADSMLGPEVKMLRFVKTGRALRLMKVLRMRKAMEIMDKLAEWYLPVGMEVVVRIFKLVLLILWANHMVACAWYAMGSQIQARDTDTGLRWTDMTLAPGSDQDYNAFGIYAYFSALHWALCQMTPGSLQVNPVNSVERWFTVMCLVVGMLFFSSMVSSVSAKLTEIRMSKEKTTDMKKKLQQFLLQKNVGKAVSLAAQKELEERLSHHAPLMSKDIKALPLLSHQSQLQISSAMFVPHLKRKALFCWWWEMHHSLVSKFCHDSLEFILLRSSDILFHPGEDARHTYIVVAGQLRYTWQPNELDLIPDVIEAKTGAWLSEAALWLKWKHVGTMSASTQCELIAIRVQGLLDHLKKSKEWLALYTFADYARCFCAIYEQTADKHFVDHMTDEETTLVHARGGPVLNDIVESNLKEILPSMRADSHELLGLVALQCLKHNGGFRSLMTSTAALNQLGDEVRCGKCLLMLDGSGEVERLISVIVLRIVAADGMIFARLGTWDPIAGKVNPSCLLPGTKPRSGEKASDTLHRAITQDLATLAHSIRLHGYEVQTESKVSLRMGTRTEYRRTVHEASLCHSWSELQQVEPERMATHAIAPTEDSRHLVRDVCLHTDPNSTIVVFYGWLSPHFFEQCKSNERLLLPHLSALTVSQRNMDQLASRSSTAASNTAPCLNSRMAL